MERAEGNKKSGDKIPTRIKKRQTARSKGGEVEERNEED